MSRYILVVFLFPSCVFALTAADYYALAPELIGAMNNSYLAIYTVATGSFVAFYLFGWSANWGIRILGFLFFLFFLETSVAGLAVSLKTMFEAQLLFISSTNVCSPNEAAMYIYKFASNPVLCNIEGVEWSQLKTSDEAYRRILERYAKAYADMELIGGGFSLASQGGGFFGKNLFFVLFHPSQGLVCLLSLSIWLVCPSKQFCARRGWINKS